MCSCLGHAPGATRRCPIGGRRWRHAFVYDWPDKAVEQENRPLKKTLAQLSMPNAYAERGNRAIEQEWLDQYIIEGIEVAHCRAPLLRTHANDRTDIGISGITPQKPQMAA
jgi:hypothetical protein